MTGPVLRVGTRGSALALAQSGRLAGAVVEAVAAIGGTGPVDVELVRIRTEGDRNPAALATIGGTGVFVTAVRDALLSGEVDLVVHSFKDLPTTPAPGIDLGAVPLREDPRDALCIRDGLRLADLPAGARIGTGSPRRKAQLLALRPDVEVIAIRGNVDTRLGKVHGGELDAVMLAAAGLRRLGREAEISEVLDLSVFVPAPAQGALAVEYRIDETPWFAPGLAAVDHLASRRAALAERAVLAELEAGCSAPVSAHARYVDDTLQMWTQVTSADGAQVVRASGTAVVHDDLGAETLGRLLARQLLDRGAAALAPGLRAASP